MDKELQQKINDLLELGHSLEVKWNCGCDEALVYLFVDGKQLSFDDSLAEEMDLYLINYLDLPDAGEFSLEGKGKIVKEGDRLFIVYTSVFKDYESDEEIESASEAFSGKQALFEEMGLH